jgi:cellulose synthase/poly-beta-1,6-N-acetylglucosamine synthase-like glycosyltransferase
VVDILREICWIVLAFSAAYGIYYIYIALHMFGELAPLRPGSGKTHRFAILICAKNEDKVIALLVSSLKAQNYPAGAFDIFVVADNCTDRTAEIAGAAGAIIYERFDLGRQSKGYALNWFFERFLKDYDSRYDACVIFDADNVVDRDFLAAMNRQLNAGHPIATGLRLGKNPSSSWVSGCGSLFWLVQTRFMHIPRARMNLPCCSVGGTGFMFDLSVLGNRGWHTSSICEDIEFTLNSIADGHFVAYAPDAVFYDEQPITLMQSLRQRYRWSLGTLQTMSTSLPKLFHSFRSGNLKVLDAIMYDCGVVVMGISGLFGILLFVLNATESSRIGGLLLYSLFGALVSYLMTLVFTGILLSAEKKGWTEDWKAVLTFPIYMSLWSAINILVLFYRDAAWHHIPHTEIIGINDVEK